MGAAGSLFTTKSPFALHICRFLPLTINCGHSLIGIAHASSTLLLFIFYFSNMQTLAPLKDAAMCVSPCWAASAQRIQHTPHETMRQEHKNLCTLNIFFYGYRRFSFSRSILISFLFMLHLNFALAMCRILIVFLLFHLQYSKSKCKGENSFLLCLFS